MNPLKLRKYTRSKRQMDNKKNEIEKKTKRKFRKNEDKIQK